MVSRVVTTQSGARQEAADGGYFASLVPAKHILLTTFKPDGAAVATPVRVVIDGDRPYFRIRGSSSTAKRLRRTGWVQVARCTVLGICRYGPVLNATARPLAGQEAGRAHTLLAGRHPGHFPGRLLRRVPRREKVHYELRVDRPARVTG